MKPNPLKRQASDTFGRNTKADMELLRRVYERSHDKSEEILALAVICAAAFSLLAVLVCIIRMFF